MSNSGLVSYTRLSPNNSGRRTHSIDRITPHCVVGQCSVETLGNIFAPATRRGSSNYGIGSDGKVGLYVDEGNRSWCSSSNANDQRAVTIECASDATPPYAFNSTVYNRLIDLCTDICRRNGKTKLLWLGSKDTTLAYNPRPNEMVLTVHRWFANKSCPGDWMMARMADLANKVTARLGGSTVSHTTSVPTHSANSSVTAVAKDVIAGKYGNGNDRKANLERAGYSYNAVQAEVNRLLGVKSSASNPTPVRQTISVEQAAQNTIKGLYGNGNTRKQRIEALGLNYNTVQNRVNEILNGKKAVPASTNKKSITDVARDVIKGKYGNGAARRANLSRAGYDYDTVQKEVNRLLK